jgi:hypothetical protein
VTEGAAVVGIELVPEVGLEVAVAVAAAVIGIVAAIVCVGGEAAPGAAAGEAGTCPVRGPPGGRMMVRSSSSGFMQRSPP